MPSIRPETLSPFGRLAVKLDEHLLELARLSGQIERLDIDSDGALERGVKLLNQFSEHGQNVSEGIQAFAKVLQEASERSKAAAELVADRAQVIHRRRDDQNRIREKLNQVEANVTAANASLAALGKNGKSEFTAQEREQLKVGLARLNEDLKKFLTEVQSIKETAGQSKFRSVERDAKNLLDALRSSSRKIDKVLGAP